MKERQGIFFVTCKCKCVNDRCNKTQFKKIRLPVERRKVVFKGSEKGLNGCSIDEILKNYRLIDVDSIDIFGGFERGHQMDL